MEEHSIGVRPSILRFSCKVERRIAKAPKGPHSIAATVSRGSSELRSSGQS
jgi:hypothetical protein